MALQHVGFLFANPKPVSHQLGYLSSTKQRNFCKEGAGLQRSLCKGAPEERAFARKERVRSRSRLEALGLESIESKPLLSVVLLMRSVQFLGSTVPPRTPIPTTPVLFRRAQDHDRNPTNMDTPTQILRLLDPISHLVITVFTSHGLVCLQVVRRISCPRVQCPLSLTHC